MIQTKWSSRHKRLYRAARHQALVKMQPLSFDGEDNWTGDDRPDDIKRYWATLSDTERAFERLQGTDAALYMYFYDNIMQSIPKNDA